MVKLLLQFVKAERAGNWEFHLLSVSAMAHISSPWIGQITRAGSLCR